MSHEHYPVNHNIFHIPEEVTTYSSLPVDFANAVNQAYLQTSHSNYIHYSRVVVGSTELEDFYDSVRQSVDYHARMNEQQPIAIVDRDGNLTLGHAMGDRDAFSTPQLLHLKTEDQNSFRLQMTHSDYFRGHEFARYSPGGPVTVGVPDRHMIFSSVLETTTWLHCGEDIQVDRKAHSRLIAVGRTAVESLPELKDRALSRAYDRIMDSPQVVAK